MTVRLVNGSNSRRGRIEVLHRGKWGTVCDRNWDNRDATVVCRMLRFPGNILFKLSNSVRKSLYINLRSAYDQIRFTCEKYEASHPVAGLSMFIQRRRINFRIFCSFVSRNESKETIL